MVATPGTIPELRIEMIEDSKMKLFFQPDCLALEKGYMYINRIKPSMSTRDTVYASFEHYQIISKITF